MPCEDRQLTQGDRVAGQQQNPGIQRAIRPFSGPATPENLVDYLNREVYPVLKQARDAVNDIYRAVADNSSSANPLGFLFSELTTGGDPTTGLVKFDNADVTAATVLRVSQTNAKRVDVGPWLEVMAGGATTPLGTVTLYHAADPGRFARFDLDSMTDIGAYWELGITPLEASGTTPWVDGDRVSLAFIPGVASGGVTVPGSVVTSTWEDVLGNGNTSGANNPTLSAGQGLVVAGGQSAGAGDIRSASDMTLAAATNIHLHCSGEIHVGHAGAATLVHVEADSETDVTSGGTMALQASTTIDLQSGTDLTATAVAGNVQLNASGFCRVITGGVERLEIEATGGWQVGGTVGSAGQVFKSNGPGTPPTWQADTDTTYTAGDGIDLTGTQFSADVSDFAGGGLEDDGANNLRTSAVSGAVSVAAGGTTSTFTGLVDPAGSLQGATQFLRWLNTGNVAFTLNVNGTTQEVSASASISTPTWAQVLASGNTSGSSNPTISSGQHLAVPGGQGATGGDIRSASDLSIEAAVSVRITTNGLERLEVESDGAWQVDGSSGTSGQSLVTQGSSASPQWADPLTIQKTNITQGTVRQIDFRDGDGVTLTAAVSGGEVVLTPNVVVNSLAGDGLEDDGSNNLRIIGGNARIVAIAYAASADASYSITPPAAATWFEAEGVGGGGGGGGADADSNPEVCAGGGGGSGGGFRFWHAITSGNITGAVGSGGTAGSNTGGDGGNGGNTTLNYASATIFGGAGGGGGGSNAGPSVANAFRSHGGGGALGTGGGSAGAGVVEGRNGAVGGDGLQCSGATADLSLALGGKGAPSMYGGGGEGGKAQGVAGAAGIASATPGSGGGGAAQISTSSSTGFAGGAGTPGRLRIVFYAGTVPAFNTIS